MHTLPPGFRIDEYEIVRVLGAGGFGITYLAFDHNLDGPVAIKEYFPADIAVRTDDARVAAAAGRSDVFAWGLDRFLREARAIHRLRHPSIVRVHRYVERHGTAYIVMEYVEGESLASILESRGQLPANEWGPWLDRLLDGLAHVHNHDYLHRDIKPANIVIRAADGEPVLIDFGAARVASQQRTHTQVLTPGYAPFEQHTSEGAQGPPTDIYALAAVSCHVLTGEPPPNAPDRMLEDGHEPLAERVAGAGVRWLKAIDDGLELRSEDRPQTVTAWRAALNETGLQPLDAAEIEKLREAASRDDPQALAQLRAEARAGNPEAQFVLGEMCHEDDMYVDHDEAVKWYRKAADLGHPGALFRLGEQRDEKEDSAAALAWYHRAAVHGHVEAQFKIGSLYREGIPPDEEAAEEWLHKAALQGHVGAEFILGTILAAGYNGLAVDGYDAVRWLRKAADHGHAGARFTLGQMYSHGKFVPRDLVVAHMWFTLAENAAARAAKLEIEPYMTSAEIDQADRRAGAYPGASPEE
ncbi:MAG: protein kinase [Acidobacteria bacterium]|nr:protein kinase [Acidobacteriota bacterium]MYH31914.1 protein kinase [Acidobacteriota bacterium]